MPREIKIFSISVVDLLCCALGGTLLVCFLLIVSIGRPGGGGSPNTFFTASAGVWLDVSDAAKKEMGNAEYEKLMEADGAVPDTQIAANAGLNRLRKDCGNVQLELYWRNEEQSPSLVAKDNASILPDFIVNSATGGTAAILRQRDATVSSNTQALGLRRITIAGVGRRLYSAFRLDAGGFRIHRGWYFLRIAVIKQPEAARIGPDTAAWLRFDCGGRPATALFQTHTTFADPDWPAGKGVGAFLSEFPTKQNAGQNGGKPADRLPDLFTPAWPLDYPNKNASTGAENTRFDFLQNDNKGRAIWAPYFALRHGRNNPLPSAARFPVTQPSYKTSPGWWREEPSENTKPLDEYLPGFQISRD